MKSYSLALAGALLAAAGVSAQAADLSAGQAAFASKCASCHGADAKTPVDPAYPILAGQHPDYLVHALKAYQRGQQGAGAATNIRKNPVMGAMAATLSADEIDNITAWLATLPSDLGTRK
jgi:cytochrome c553